MDAVARLPLRTLLRATKGRGAAGDERAWLSLVDDLGMRRCVNPAPKLRAVLDALHVPPYAGSDNIIEHVQQQKVRWHEMRVRSCPAPDLHGIATHHRCSAQADTEADLLAANHRCVDAGTLVVNERPCSPLHPAL